MRLSACKWCGRSIFWAETAAGKRLPLDPPRKAFEPPFEQQPNVFVDPDTEVARVLARAELEVWPEHLKAKLWLPHWASCPYSREIRERIERRRREARERDRMPS